MGLQQSKEELLYQQVSYGNVQGIIALHRDGARLEWVDKQGKTPLILASMMPNGLPLVKTLLQLGANVNAYRPGSYAGTPLHHAAKIGLDQTVHLLLSYGADPFKINDNGQTALDLARAKGHANVVRTIENHICLFSGWLRLRSRAPNILEALLPQFLTKKIWVSVLPCHRSNPMAPPRFELVMYSELQKCEGLKRYRHRRQRRTRKGVKMDAHAWKAAQPDAIVALWKANVEEPDFNEPDPSIVIYDEKIRYKFLSANEGDKQQLMHFYNSCKGVPQENAPVPPVPTHPSVAAPIMAPIAITGSCSFASEDEELSMAMAISASIQSAIKEGIPIPDIQSISDVSSSSDSSSSENMKYDKRICGWAASDPGLSSSTSVQENSSEHGDPLAFVSLAHDDIPPPSIVAPSAPPESFADGFIHYPCIDCNPVTSSQPVRDIGGKTFNGQKGNIIGTSSGSCVICLDAAVEGACIPCGHMAGCMSCLNEIKAKNWGCPVCRAKIDQVVKLYAV